MHFQYNPYASGSIGDEKRRWKEFKEFRDLFQCSNCGKKKFKRNTIDTLPHCVSCETPFRFKESVFYFAYGSNMKSSRLNERIKSAHYITTGYIEGYKFECSKLSTIDGSGKANITKSIEDKTWGVLYIVCEDDIKILDKEEGGYNRITLEIIDSNENSYNAEVYISDSMTEVKIPTTLYKRHIVDGAKEHVLPEFYIEFLENLPEK